MTPEELASARWFRSKQRPIATVDEVDRAPLTADAALSVLEVAYRDGGHSDRYLAPRVAGREPAEGEGAWRAIAEAIAQGAELPATRGVFVGVRTSRSQTEPIDALTERRLGVEQSNTSVVLGDRLILKLYRLMEAGENPDLEIGAFLIHAGFADTPAVIGALHYDPPDGERATVAMLQAYVPSTGDAWVAMLDALATDPARGIELAASLGDLTRRMHVALASRSSDPSFPSRPATTTETAAWRASAEGQLALAIGAVGGEAHDRLVELAPRVSARFADTFGSATGQAWVSRIHGDYHLGQLLARTDGGFSVIDFEGEPAHPLSERRHPGSPLRDVAGMLRSLDYAARTRASSDPGFEPDAWLGKARRRFLEAYGGIDAGSARLLDAFELEKACYEIRYEAGNRPDWLGLPLAAVDRLVSSV
jgi:maltokinase